MGKGWTRNEIARVTEPDIGRQLRQLRVRRARYIADNCEPQISFASLYTLYAAHIQSDS